MGDESQNKIGHIAKGAKASSGVSTIANAVKLAKELKPMLEMLQSFKRDASYAFSSVGGTIVTKIPQGELIEAYYKFAKSKDGAKGTGKVYPMRQIDSVAEAHIIDRVKELRGNLTSGYKKSGNFALAEVNVNGIDKSEFFAQSSIDEFTDSIKERVPNISLQPKNPMFNATITQDMIRTSSRTSQSISIYGSNNLMHKGVTLKARGTNDFSLDVTIINKK
ncbi:TPA: hypothetical protein QC096_003861 [Bacillus thuringiensis]|nr:hypothetical protein [Bacillus wiedmannii]HDR8172620.1 hypothetical protein [Bacillus thuringiensis]